MSSVLLHAFVVLAASAVTVAAGAALSRRRKPAASNENANSALSAYVAVIGTLYAVLVAFVLLSVWDQYDTAHQAAEHEASEIANFLHLTAGLPEPAALQLRQSVREYASAVIDDEWSRMPAGVHSERATRAIHHTWDLLVMTDPVGARVVNVHSAALDRLRGAADGRRDRLSQARPSVQPVIWILLVGGGVLTLLATSFFETSSGVHLPVNAGLTLMIAFMLYLIFAFDRPFSGDVGWGPDALRAVIASFGG